MSGTEGVGQGSKPRSAPAGRFERSFLIAHHISLHDLRKKRPSDLDGSGIDRLTDIRNQN